MVQAFIRHIDELKACGVFREAPKGQVEFGRYNLLYGWNGSGKTTISRVLRSVEKGHIDPAFCDDSGNFPTDLAFKLRMSDGTVIDHKNLTGLESKVRVFNCDFVRDNLNVDDGTAQPVYYLGEEQGDALKEFDKVSDDLKTSEDALTKINNDLKNKQDGLNTQLSSQAKIISDHLADKGFNRTSMSKLLQNSDFQYSWTSFTLSDADRDTMIRASKGVNDHVGQPTFSVSLPHVIDDLLVRTQEIAGRTITKKAIEELDNNATLKKWVSEGLDLHQDRTECAFCKSDVSAERIEELNEYFNDAYKNLISDVDQVCADIEACIKSIKQTKPVDALNLFTEYREEYKAASQSFTQKKTALINNFTVLHTTMLEKKNQSFSSLDVPASSQTKTLFDDLDEAAKTVDGCIKKHNQHCTDFQKKVSEAKDKVRKHYAADIYETFKQESQKIEELEQEKEGAEIKKNALQTRYDELDGALSTHYFALERINKLLSSFMGRKDIILTANEKGYSIKRNGVIAKNLSEGEKTAIAFCYFISKMDEKGFEIKDSLIVVDDPISSLDTNALYAAGAFIRMHLQHANQLVILTHNHRFFREMYGWISGMKEDQFRPKEGQSWKGYFMVKCHKTNNGGREGKITKLDKVLMHYDSEYIYHCKLLFEVAGKLGEPNEEQLEKLILLPNIARKVVETFLLFKFPNQLKEPLRVYNAAKTFTNQMEEEKLSILDRLVNRASHGDDGKMSSINIFDLDETPKVIEYALEFIKEADEIHYNELALACGIKVVSENKKAAA
jgi:wobble nucleotide-excising tRNase